MKLDPRRVRAGLGFRGKSIRAWAHENGFSDQLKTIYAILNGRRTGRNSPALMRALKGIRA